MQDGRQGPTGPTKPFNRGRTTPFGDEFVATGKKDPAEAAAAAAASGGTRPLPGLPPQNMIAAVTSKIGEIKRELDYIRHLTNLFAPPIAVLRVGVKLSDDTPAAPPPSSQVDEALVGMLCPGCGQPIDETSPAGICVACGGPYHVDCWDGACRIPECEQTEFMAPEAGRARDPRADLLIGLSTDQADLAQAIGIYLRSNPKVKQRAQVCLYQYEEAYRAYQQSDEALDEAAKLPPASAWDRLHEIGIERVKGKAYAICGFYENFKTDGPVSQVFPPPRNQGAEPNPATKPLNPQATRAPTQVPPSPPPHGPDGDDDAPLPIENAIGGLIGKLRGLFK